MIIDFIIEDLMLNSYLQKNFHTLNIANALSVSVDDLLCDNVIHAKPQFENDIKLLLDDCDDYEIRIVKDLLSTIIYTLRRDLSLKKHRHAQDDFTK